jgi:hypothetical protein
MHSRQLPAAGPDLPDVRPGALVLRPDVPGRTAGQTPAEDEARSLADPSRSPGDVGPEPRVSRATKNRDGQR